MSTGGGTQCPREREKRFKSEHSTKRARSKHALRGARLVVVDEHRVVHEVAQLQQRGIDRRLCSLLPCLPSAASAGFRHRWRGRGSAADATAAEDARAMHGGSGGGGGGGLPRAGRAGQGWGEHLEPGALAVQVARLGDDLSGVFLGLREAPHTGRREWAGREEDLPLPGASTKVGVPPALIKASIGRLLLNPGQDDRVSHRIGL